MSKISPVAVCQMLRAGHNDYQTARAFGCSAKTIRVIRLAVGIPPQQRRYYVMQQRERIRELLARGHTVGEIAAMIDRSERQVRRAVQSIRNTTRANDGHIDGVRDSEGSRSGANSD